MTSAGTPSPVPTPEWAEELSPVYVGGLFRPLLTELTTLLRGLSEDDWARPTVAGTWLVRDVAAHLLDCGLRKVAVYRDGHRTPPPFPIDTDRALTRFINQLNAGGVSFGERLSSRILTDLLEITDAWVTDVHESLPPHGPAIFAVNWAGESQSENWMDVGREYTERWHHQMQIRDAVGAARLLDPKWMTPLLDLSVRAFPVAYADVEGIDGTTVVFQVDGATSGAWTVLRSQDRWRVVRGRPTQATAVMSVEADDAWRLLYNAANPALLDRLVITGDASLVQAMVRARSVIV